MDWKIQNDLKSWTWQKQSCGICVQDLRPDHQVITAETGEKLPKKVCIRYLLSWQHFLSVVTFLWSQWNVVLCYDVFVWRMAGCFVCLCVCFVCFFQHTKEQSKQIQNIVLFFFGIRTYVHNCNKRRGMPVSVHRDYGLDIGTLENTLTHSTPWTSILVHR